MEWICERRAAVKKLAAHLRGPDDNDAALVCREQHPAAAAPPWRRVGGARAGVWAGKFGWGGRHTQMHGECGVAVGTVLIQSWYG